MPLSSTHPGGAKVSPSFKTKLLHATLTLLLLLFWREDESVSVKRACPTCADVMSVNIVIMGVQEFCDDGYGRAVL